MFVNTDEFYIEAFEEYSKLINNFAEESNISVITTNKFKTWEESDLIEWSKMRSIMKDDENMVKKEQKISIVSLEGFTEEDENKVSDIVEKALLQYDINILFINEQIKLQTMKAFFDKVEDDIGIIKRIKSSGVSPSNGEIRYYRGKFSVKRISAIDSSKTATYEALEDGDKFKKGDTMTLSTNQCWRNRK